MMLSFSISEMGLFICNTSLYISTMPPSTTTSVPVIKLESSLARNRTVLASSIGSPPLLCRSMADHDFAGDLAARVMAQTGFGVFERKHAVDDRLDLMLFHHAAQVFEITTAAGRNRLVCRLAQEHGHEVDAARPARPSTHQGNLGAIGDGLDP